MKTPPITSATHPPGRATDAAVARALGHTIETQYRRPRYTADASDGWAAMREMWAWLRKRGGWTIRTLSDGVCIYSDMNRFALQQDRNFIARAPTLPHALALLVLMVAEAEQRAKGEDAN